MASDNNTTTPPAETALANTAPPAETALASPAPPAEPALANPAPPASAPAGNNVACDPNFRTDYEVTQDIVVGIVALTALAVGVAAMAATPQRLVCPYVLGGLILGLGLHLGSDGCVPFVARREALAAWRRLRALWARADPECRDVLVGFVVLWALELMVVRRWECTLFAAFGAVHILTGGDLVRAYREAGPEAAAGTAAVVAGAAFDVAAVVLRRLHAAHANFTAFGDVRLGMDQGGLHIPFCRDRRWPAELCNVDEFSVVDVPFDNPATQARNRRIATWFYRQHRGGVPTAADWHACCARFGLAEPPPHELALLSNGKPMGYSVGLIAIDLSADKWSAALHIGDRRCLNFVVHKAGLSGYDPAAIVAKVYGCQSATSRRD